MGFMDTLALPPEMIRLDHWIVWETQTRDGKRTKIPINPHTRSFGATDDPETWASYETASDVAQENENYGLGFVFTDEDNLVGIDLDHMRDPETGEIDDVANDIIEELDSYTEISPSGTGFHIIVRGKLPRGRNRKDGIEMYEEGRFFTVTGSRLPGTEPHVQDRDGPLRVVHHEYVAKDAMTDGATTTTGGSSSSPDAELEDHDVLVKAKESKNGKKFEALWNGLTSGYDSHSEADLALCSYLAFWTGGDKHQMDRLFRDSGLMRAKWDREHSSKGKTYGEMTVDTAVRTANDFYGGD